MQMTVPAFEWEWFSRLYFPSKSALLWFFWAILGGCSTNTVNTSTVVCNPGEQICDDAATRVLECHPNGAAWVILDHCAETQVCLDATCVGEVPTSAVSDAIDESDSDAGEDAEPTEEDAQSEGDSEQVSPEESESPEDPEE